MNQNEVFKDLIMVEYNVMINFGTWICYDCLKDVFKKDNIEFFSEHTNCEYITEKEDVSEILQNYLKTSWKKHLQFENSILF